MQDVLVPAWRYFMDISFKWGNSLFVRLSIVFVIVTTMIAILPARHVFTQMIESLSPTTNIVIDGNARFTVLTPMVIRLEYANDGNFQNGTTFNVINRTFPIPNYSTQVVNGWREISTDDLTLRYKEGSGMFSPTNLTMLLKGQSKMVIPDWGQATFSPCTFAQNCETENAFLSGGAAIATDHQSYTGTGFVGGYQQSGSSATWVVHDSPLASSDTLSIRYANATGGDGLNETRTLDLYVNGTNTGAVSFPRQPTGIAGVRLSRRLPYRKAITRLR